VNANDKTVMRLKTIFELEFGAIAIRNIFFVHDVSFYSQNLNVLRFSSRLSF
jgi:hypothetical protein